MTAALPKTGQVSLRMESRTKWGSVSACMGMRSPISKREMYVRVCSWMSDEEPFLDVNYGEA